MFFKRIEIVGFKSFATRTVFDLIPGTTIVVGPNGCGKSNILDAIKWVLGEQGAKQLRGKSMQDVIFSGSASFKALGVAEVKLTIDNRNRWLPTDYHEVQVTRRLFRSGDSEYLINKQPCRLRDVHNLFLGTGVGKSSYSMIEQGRIGQIINSKPIERRFLFEEAAGISKFKVRKLEALRKLERTEQDLTRLNDLIGEVDRQVNSLKRQAGKARRYKELIDAHRKAEQELIVLRSTAIREQLNQLNTQTADFEDRLAKLRTERAQKQSALEQARQNGEELNTILHDDSQILFDLQRNLSNCEHQIERLQDRIQGNARRKAQIEQELKELAERQRDVLHRAQEITERIEVAEASRLEFQQKFEALSRDYEALTESGRSRAEAIDSLSHRVTELRNLIAQADNEVRGAESALARLEGSRQETVETMASLELESTEAAETFGRLSLQLSDVELKLSELENNLKTGRESRATTQNSLGHRLKQLEELNRQLHQGQSRLDTLEELAANYEGFHQGVREVLLAVDNRQLKGLLGVPASLLQCVKEHELAIEVALGSQMQHVIAETASDSRDAIMYLKQHGKGRATFLPLDQLHVSPLHSSLRGVLKRPGVVGLGIDLVQYDPKIQRAAEFLLGQTIVVETLDVGMDLSREGFRGRYVSLDGQLINPSGAMTGGRINISGLMTREREIRELGEKLTGLRQTEQTTREGIRELQDNLENLNKSIAGLQEDFDKLRLEKQGLQKDVNVAQQRDQSALQKLQERQEQLNRIDSDVARNREVMAASQQKSDAAQAELAETEQALENERDQARSQTENIMQLGTAKAEARTEVAKAIEQIEGAKREHAELNRETEALDRQQKQREQETRQIDDDAGRVKQQVERIRAEIDALGRDRDQKARVLNDNQARNDGLANTIKELTSNLETLDRDERDLDNKLRERQMGQVESKTRLNDLSEQCETKYGLTLDGLAGQVGAIERDSGALQVEVADMKRKLDAIGVVNPDALEQFEEQSARLEFLQKQHTDLSLAREQLTSTIDKLDETTRKLFHETFEIVRGHFIEMFRKLFNGGKADLILEAPEGMDPLLDGGVEIVAQPPGKKLQNITLMSGGEKAMTAISLLFALFLHKPSPFCILDEIDAPLDDANVQRFKAAIEDFKGSTQFLVITHNKLTMELADALYGVTMEESGVSKLVSVRFEQAAELVG